MINSFGKEQKKEEKLPGWDEICRKEEELKANRWIEWMKDEIIKMAKGFYCCPRCGALVGGYSHYCDQCKTRYVEAGDAYWFAEYLKRRWKE